MSLATDVAIGAAERLERTAGPGPGLALWRRLASNAGSADLRGRAILGGLRCAIATGDRTAIRNLSLLWATIEVVSEAAWDGVFASCRALSRAGLGGAAIELAYAEVKRSPTARALYAYARCLDVAIDPRAVAAFRDAIERGEREQALPLVRAARVRRAAWLARSADTLNEALEEAKRVASAEATPAERLVLARVLLRSSSRFARASAIGLLDELVTRTASDQGREAADLARRAVALAARHADDRNDELTSLESDRLLALFSREPIAKDTGRVRDTLRVIARLAVARARGVEDGSDLELEAALDEAARVDPELAVLHRRAREILQGRVEVWGSVRSNTHADWNSLLDAVVALRDAARPRIIDALCRLAESAERGRHLPAHVWTVATAALASDDADVRAAAGRVASAMMSTSTAPPPRGWLQLANALAACKLDELATTARRSAALAKEPGAAEALTLSLTRSGWQLALAGDRSMAIARLREARSTALSHRPAPAVPDSQADAPRAQAPGGEPSRSR